MNKKLTKRITPGRTIRFFTEMGQSSTSGTSSSSVPAIDPPTIPGHADLNVPEAMVNAEWRIMILEHVIDRLIERAPADALTAEDLEAWREKSFEMLCEKYPKAGLTRTPEARTPGG